jgi:hypothetical protein
MISELEHELLLFEMESQIPHMALELPHIQSLYCNLELQKHFFGFHVIFCCGCNCADIAQTPSNDQMWGAGLQCLPLNPSSPTDIALSSVWVMGNPTKPASDICSPDHAAYLPAIGK